LDDIHISLFNNTVTTADLAQDPEDEKFNTISRLPILQDEANSRRLPPTSALKTYTSSFSEKKRTNPAGEGAIRGSVLHARGN
jgi:hypothetical protein